MRFTFALLAAAVMAAGGGGGGTETALDMANRGAQLFADANYGEAEVLYRRALEAWPQGEAAVRGKAIVLGNLGTLLRATGRYSEAEPMLQDAVKQLEAVGETANVDTARLLDSLAVLYRNQGDLAKAETYALRAAPMADEGEKPANRQVVASIYLQEKRYSEAEPMLRVDAEGGTGRAAITAYLNLAASDLMQGRSVRAEHDARRALELAGPVLPKSHPAVAMALNDLAQACRMQGQYMEAEQSYREAVAIWEETLGPNHPDLAMGLIGLAGFYHERQRETGAEQLYERALSILERTFGGNDSRVLVARNELADVLRGQRRYTESEKLSRVTVAAMEKTFGAQDPRVTHALTNYARLLAETKRKGEAADVLKRIQANNDGFR